ncbi:MAG: bifunctional alpha,alpha-trehalose-phosphate synthase (UDP-forming)/trehalose-phosphatase [Candidatus Methylomirabilales bacterium]
MERLVLVSNRLPVTVDRKKGELDFYPSVGGLATGLASLYKAQESIWIGWPGLVTEDLHKGEKEAVTERFNEEYRSHPVFLSQEDVASYYEGFSNRTLWPLFTYFPHHTSYDEELWEAYQRVNEHFRDVILNVVSQDDILWIHDYHLMLLPSLIREELPDVRMGFFLHIPFPSFEIFRLLPWREELLRGVLGADLVGFHTYDYVRHFRSSVRKILGAEEALDAVILENRLVRLDAFPMGIDYERFAGAVESPGVQREVRRIRDEVGQRQAILSLDRLDYTKGILERLDAFDLFLEENPEYKQRVTLILGTVPSRIGVEAYASLKKEIDARIGRLNGKYGSIGWVPVWYLYRMLDFSTLVALYHYADVALVTPLRDGMNLIAKEYLATKLDAKGVLILSERAGAEKELGEALVVNPNDPREVAGALREALVMSEEEQRERNEPMQWRLRRYGVLRWAEDFLDRLADAKERQRDFYAKALSHRDRKTLVEAYQESRSRLLLLDYDGTLTSFHLRPGKAVPDEDLAGLLARLSSDPANEVVLVSGRDRPTLEAWFGGERIGLVAEHGAWSRRRGGAWRKAPPARNDWKPEISSILEWFVDRTPGASVEEKEFSLVWHYRRVDPDMAALRARELTDRLRHHVANLGLAALEGNKVVEVRNAGVDKGTAVQKWLQSREWDFVLSVGDDVTDEDVFGRLPDTAHSLKVGMGPTKAARSVAAPEDVRSLLAEFVKA